MSAIIEQNFIESIITMDHVRLYLSSPSLDMPAFHNPRSVRRVG